MSCQHVPGRNAACFWLSGRPAWCPQHVQQAWNQQGIPQLHPSWETRVVPYQSLLPVVEPLEDVQHLPQKRVMREGQLRHLNLAHLVWGSGIRF